jgi:hypothetical protein
MDVQLVYDGIAGIGGLSFFFVGLRRARPASIPVAQRAFWLSLGAGILCALIARLSGNNDIWIFGALVCGLVALLTFIIWRLPRLARALVDADGWDTPTT